MKYTMSNDGVPRVNLNFTERVSQAELAELNKQAQALGYKNYRAYVEGQLSGVQLRLLEEYDEMQKQARIDAAWGERQTTFKVTFDY